MAETDSDVEPDRSRTAARQTGTVLMWLGALAAVLIVLDRSGVRFMELPGFWYRSRPFHLLLCIGLWGAGIAAYRGGHSDDRQIDDESDDALLRPVFDRIRVYTRADCPLCDEAILLLSSYEDQLPPVECVDVSTDQVLEQQHGEWIPVVEIDGRVRFRGRIDEELLERMVRARLRKSVAAEKEH